MSHFITDRCNACSACVELCPTGAAAYPSGGNGVGYKSPVIDAEKCIDCGVCADNCSGDAIEKG